MEREEVEGETGVYARESGNAKTGNASERLAVEQFFLLRQRGKGVDPHRPGEGVKNRVERAGAAPNKNLSKDKVNPRTLKTAGCGTPTSSPGTLCAPPATL